MAEFTESIYNRFSDILLAKQKDDNLSIHYTKNVIDVNGDEGRLYIKLFRDEIQIPYIVFKNKRVGTGTEVINECINIGKSLGLSKVMILGVLTKEMELLCEKMKFIKYRDNGFGHYDYMLEI
ncbi:hypothetical protein ACEE21_15075 [Clostridium baratii]